MPVVRFKLFILSLPLLCWLMSACSPDTECRTANNIGMQVVFALDSMRGDTALVSFSRFDSLTVQGVGNDSVLYDNQKAVSSIFLPLRTDTNLTSYALSAYNRRDTLYISHDNNQVFVSLACGCFVFHTLNSLNNRGGLIDSIEMLNATIENYKQDNVRLYIHL